MLLVGRGFLDLMSQIVPFQEVLFLDLMSQRVPFWFERGRRRYRIYSKRALSLL